jgi:hypothetical protein
LRNQFRREYKKKKAYHTIPEEKWSTTKKGKRKKRKQNAKAAYTSYVEPPPGLSFHFPLQKCPQNDWTLFFPCGLSIQL